MIIMSLPRAEEKAIEELREEIKSLKKELEELKGALKRTLEVLDEYFFDLEVRRRIELLEKGEEELVGEEEVMRALE
ncbi:MAG: hypothetical protein DRO05_06445 [Thermoproteota archaeon]|nr:MAG: hypothetical protein DRO05_06445 [Candidatus Korarchaeota archaeon]